MDTMEWRERTHSGLKRLKRKLRAQGSSEPREQSALGARGRLDMSQNNLDTTVLDAELCAPVARPIPHETLSLLVSKISRALQIVFRVGSHPPSYLLQSIRYTCVPETSLTREPAPALFTEES
jgi:hypothetical protein